MHHADDVIRSDRRINSMQNVFIQNFNLKAHAENFFIFTLCNPTDLPTVLLFLVLLHF